MALRAGALTTYAAVKEALGLTSDAQQSTVERAIDAASAAIASFCNRTFSSASVTERGPLQPRPDTIILPQRPVTALTSWTLDGAAQDVADLVIEDADSGLVRLPLLVYSTYEAASPLTLSPDVATRTARVEVTYTGGWVLPNEASPTLPADLEEACIATAVSIFQGRTRDRSVVSESLGDYSVGFAGRNTAIGRGAGGLIPDEVLPILLHYQVLVQA